jgi:post-segregation antitoxin (ccd killing protein)
VPLPLPWLKRLDHSLRKVGLRQGWIGSTKIINRIPVNTVANRSISISLEEELLAQLDAQGSNRSALVSQALSEWLARRRIDALNTAPDQQESSARPGSTTAKPLK